ncbi:MAG: response regulator [Pseudomonadota bacterium]
MSKLSILIVEDEAIIAYDLAGKVRQLGYDVAGTTALGEEAIELVRLHRPALVLMDVQLAGAMDGIAAAIQINRECHLPILFLTANADLGTDERALRAGAVGIIKKPFDKRDVRIQIEKALRQNATEKSGSL